MKMLILNMAVSTLVASALIELRSPTAAPPTSNSIEHSASIASFIAADPAHFTAAPAEQSASRDNAQRAPNADALAKLEERLATLEAVVGGLRLGALDAPPIPSTAPSPQPHLPDREPHDIDAAFDDVLLAQRPNPATEEMVVEMTFSTLSAGSMDATELTTIECGDQHCRLEFEHANAEEQAWFTENYPLFLPPGSTSATRQRNDVSAATGESISTTIAYLTLAMSDQ